MRSGARVGSVNLFCVMPPKFNRAKSQPAGGFTSSASGQRPAQKGGKVSTVTPETRRNAAVTQTRGKSTSSSSTEIVEFDKLERALGNLSLGPIAAARSPNTSKSNSKWSATASAASVRGRTQRSLSLPGRESGAVRRFSVASLKSPVDIARALGAGHFKEVVCLVGAGISTTSGIPDFRTKGSGLYDNLAQYRLPEPEAIFDLEFYLRNPEPFITLAKDLYPGKYQPNRAHHFMRLLHDKSVLRRVYTQNIDGLERLAGIPAGKLVEAHGTFSTASCLRCHRSQDSKDVRAMIMAGAKPRCVYCKGLAKPDIVFFGEDLPNRFHRLHRADLKTCDLLIVMGTSLSVEPFASLADEVRSSVPRLLVNRELVGLFSRRRARRPCAAPDMAILGDLVEELGKFSSDCSWAESLRKLEDPECESDDSNTDRGVATQGQATKNQDLATSAEDTVERVAVNEQRAVETCAGAAEDAAEGTLSSNSGDSDAAVVSSSSENQVQSTDVAPNPNARSSPVSECGSKSANSS